MWPGQRILPFFVKRKQHGFIRPRKNPSNPELCPRGPSLTVSTAREIFLPTSGNSFQLEFELAILWERSYLISSSQLDSRSFVRMNNRAVRRARDSYVRSRLCARLIGIGRAGESGSVRDRLATRPRWTHGASPMTKQASSTVPQPMELHAPCPASSLARYHYR
jgi:hypothetical protein